MIEVSIPLEREEDALEFIRQYCRGTYDVEHSMRERQCWGFPIGWSVSDRCLVAKFELEADAVGFSTRFVC